MHWQRFFFLSLILLKAITDLWMMQNNNKNTDFIYFHFLLLFAKGKQLHLIWSMILRVCIRSAAIGHGK